VNKKYHIHLTTDERTMLEQVVRTGATPAITQSHARILLKADQSDGGPGWPDHQIAEAMGVSAATVERVRHLWVSQGRTVALERKKPTGRPRRKLDGAQEAQLAAIACSPPPDGAERWTLALLADKLVELKVVDSIARDTVRVTLKKTRSSPG
jgi:transposase